MLGASHTAMAFSGQPVAGAGAALMPQTTSNILIMGDSLSAAYDMPVEDGWVALLEKRLEGHCRKTKVHNASISGETTGGGLHRLPGVLKRTSADVVVIELGGNDGLQGFPIDRVKNNLAKMIRLSEAAGAKVLLAGVRIPPNYGAAYSDRLFAMYFELQKQFNIQLVPFILEGIATKDHLMQEDGVHPNSQAQPLVLDNMWPDIKTLLPCAA